MKANEQTHAFSIELKHKAALKHLGIPNDPNSNILIEGYIGELQSINHIENALLEIEGANGILRIDLKTEEIKKLHGHR